jgi:thiamine pyrophosphokinase
MKKAICYIVGSGKFPKKRFKPEKGSLIIAADGGYDSLKKVGYIPDIIVGDMDSIKKIPKNIPRLVFPERKNDTDISLCIKLAERLGYIKTVLLGISGNRHDHFLGTIQLMARYSEKGMHIRAILNRYDIYAITSEVLALPKLERGKMFSVICPYDRAQGVSLLGLSYEIYNATLTNRFPLGISNEGIGKTPKICVKKGTVLVFVER